MIDNSITDIVIPNYEKSVIIPKECIEYANKWHIFIPNYLETIQKAFYEREFVKLDYKTRIISSKKYFKNLLETISVFQQNRVTPEELFSLVCELVYDWTLKNGPYILHTLHFVRTVFILYFTFFF